MNAEDLTVFITNWNYGEYLQKAIDSVQKQTIKPNWMVIDDCSSDTSVEIYKKIPNNVHRLVCRSGCIKARQRGLDLCRTKWIVYLDADDELENCFVEEVLRAAAEQNVSWVYGNCLAVNESGNPMFVCTQKDFDPVFLKKQNFIQSCCLLRADLLRKAGGWREYISPETGQIVKGLEDWDLWIRLSDLGERAYRVPKILLRYRQHGLSRINGGRGI